MDIVDRFGTAELGKRAAKDIADAFLAEGIRKRFARLSREGYLGAARCGEQRGNLLPVLRERLTMPVLVCIGEDDPVRSACDVMVRELPEAQATDVQGHRPRHPGAAPEQYAGKCCGSSTTSRRSVRSRKAYGGLDWSARREALPRRVPGTRR